MTSRTSRPEDLLVPSAASSRELGEEESGVRARSAESRAAVVLKIAGSATAIR